MGTLNISLRGNCTVFSPGQEIAGVVSWQLDRAPPAAELRLFWFTRGKHTMDVGIVATESFDYLRAEDARPFSLHSPEAPHSYSGTLFSVIWALELIVESHAECGRLEITITPGGG
jgi:hypothetical protein